MRAQSASATVSDVFFRAASLGESAVLLDYDAKSETAKLSNIFNYLSWILVSADLVRGYSLMMSA